MRTPSASASTPRAKRRRQIGVCAVVAALSLVAACGGDDDEAATSNTTSGAASTEAGSTDSSAPTGGGESGGVAEAKAATEENLKEPTTIAVTEPLNEKPPSEGLFIYMQCDVNQCKDNSDGIKAATEAIGWDFKAITYEGANPATLIAGLQQALTEEPTAVGLTGLPEAVWGSVKPDYEAAGIPIVTGYIGPQENVFPIIGQVGGTPDVTRAGEMIANWVVADSEGQAKILLQSVNDYPVLKVFSDAYKAKMAELCPDCEVTEINNTLDQLGTGVVPAIVSALQSDPDIGYVVTVNGPFVTGLTSALAAAGLEDVKIAGESGDTTNLTNIQSGTEHAFTALALHYNGWSMVDMVLRHLQGMEYEMDGNGGAPMQLLTKDVDYEIANSYDKPADYAEQFKKLWLVG